MKRRNFIRIAPALASSPYILSSLHSSPTPPAQNIEKTTILFQGDSITDSGRDKKSENPDQPISLGRGYVFLAATQLYEQHPELHPQVYNRGVSGNKVYQMADRWEVETLLLEPDVISILIGVNDHWHSLKDYKGTPEKYRTDYDQLLVKTRKELPDVKLIICEPFVLLDGSAIENDRDKWSPAFDEYQRIARELADKHMAAFVPFQSTFDEALKRAPASYWAHDGVHPTLAGAQLMANHWIEVFNTLQWH